jgi:nucleotide-binding universal stress UspA family protein
MQVRRVLATIDLAAPSPKTLVAAAELATVAQADLTVLTVIRDPWALVHADEIEGFRRTHSGSPADLAASRATERLREMVQAAALATPSVTYRAAFGVPGIEIPRIAEEEHADVVVLGRAAPTERHEPGKRVTEATLRRSRVPVLIAPPTHHVYRRVLACVDDSHNAPAVLSAAQAIAECFHARPLALHVQPTSVPPMASAGRPRWLRRLEQGEGEGGAAVAVCETIVREGSPATEILAAASAEDADLIVIGYCRGMSLDDANGIAVRVLRRAPCAVLAVPI